MDGARFPASGCPHFSPGQARVLQPRRLMGRRAQNAMGSGNGALIASCYSSEEEHGKVRRQSRICFGNALRTTRSTFPRRAQPGSASPEDDAKRIRRSRANQLRGECRHADLFLRRWRRRRRSFLRALWGRCRRRFGVQQFYLENQSRIGADLRTHGAFAICKIRRNEHLIF